MQRHHGRVSGIALQPGKCLFHFLCDVRLFEVVRGLNKLGHHQHVDGRNVQEVGNSYETFTGEGAPPSLERHEGTKVARADADSCCGFFLCDLKVFDSLGQRKRKGSPAWNSFWGIFI